MNTRANKNSNYILSGAVVICIVWLVYQYIEIRSLRLQMTEQRASLELVSSEAAAALAKSEDQESRIELLESTANKDSGETNFPSIDKLNALQPGFYQLTTSTQYSPDVEEFLPYTINHVMVQLHYENYDTQLSVGLASSGLIPQGVYFDYDNDGRIDVDMALNFVREIPVFGRSLAKAYDPMVAQNLYSIFVNESENAEYTSIDDLANDAEAASSYLWIFLENQYEDIEDWVLENLPDQLNEQ